jgi:hypothetical protein
MTDWNAKVDAARSKDDKKEWSDVFADAIKSTPESSWNFVKDLFQFARHPLKAAETMGQVAAGGVEKLIPGRQGSEPQFDAAVEHFSGRYGSLENFKKTVSEDPVGVLADLSTVVTGAGGAARGAGTITSSVARGAGTIAKADKLTKIGGIVQKTGAAMEPLQIAKQTLKAVPTGKMYESAAKFSTVAKKPGESSKVVRQRMTKTALDYGIMPTYKGLEKLEGLLKQVGGEIGVAVKSAKGPGTTRSAGDLFKNFDSIEEWARKWSTEPTKNIAQLKKIKSEFEKVWGTYDPVTKERVGWAQMSPEDLQTKKTAIYEELESFYERVKKQPAKIKGMKQIARNAKEMLEGIIPEIKGMNESYGPLKELHKAIDRVAGRITNRDILGIGIPIKTGAGYAAAGGSPLGAGAGLVWGLLDTPVVKAKMAILTKQLQRKLGPISPTQAAISLGLFQTGRLTEMRIRGEKSR